MQAQGRTTLDLPTPHRPRNPPDATPAPDHQLLVLTPARTTLPLRVALLPAPTENIVVTDSPSVDEALLVRSGRLATRGRNTASTVSLDESDLRQCGPAFRRSDHPDIVRWNGTFLLLSFVISFSVLSLPFVSSCLRSLLPYHTFHIFFLFPSCTIEISFVCHCALLDFPSFSLAGSSWTAWTTTHESQGNIGGRAPNGGSARFMQSLDSYGRPSHLVRPQPRTLGGRATCCRKMGGVQPDMSERQGAQQKGRTPLFVFLPSSRSPSFLTRPPSFPLHHNHPSFRRQSSCPDPPYKPLLSANPLAHTSNSQKHSRLKLHTTHQHSAVILLPASI